MAGPITEADAVRRFPELRELVAARDVGWIFRPVLEEAGALEGIVGSYSRQQYTDALFIFDRTNVSAARVLDSTYGGGCVWSRQGAALQEVVHDLLELPAPGTHGAPSLVTRSGLLWTP